MAGKSNVIAGLDIGTTNTRVVVAEFTPEKKINILGIGAAPSRGLRKGVIINIESTIEGISKALAQARTMSGCEIDSVIASISGSHILGQNNNGIVPVKNREVGWHDVEKVVEAARAIAMPADREILHVIPQEYKIDDQDGIREPVGISGVRLEAWVHIITQSVASAQNLIKCTNRCGLAVSDVVFSALASSRAVLSPEEQELGVCLLDIGGGTTDIIVFHGGAVRHTAVLPVGGNHISNDVSAGLRTPIAAAEEIKIRYGSAVPVDSSRDETIEVPSTGGRSARVLTKTVLSEIIEPRVNEIFTLVRDNLLKAGCYDMLTSGLVLTGGTAAMKGMVQAAEKVFNMPVRTGQATSVGGLTDLVKGPEYASAVGLAVYGATQPGAAARKGGGLGLKGMFKKVGNWFSDRF